MADPSDSSDPQARVSNWRRPDDPELVRFARVLRDTVDGWRENDPILAATEEDAGRAAGDGADGVRCTLDGVVCRLAAAAVRSEPFLRSRERLRRRHDLKSLLRPVGGLLVWNLFLKPIRHLLQRGTDRPIPVDPDETGFGVFPIDLHPLCVLQQYRPRPLSYPAWYGERQAQGDLPSMRLVTPSYNQAAYLADTMASVLDQGYPRLAYVVQDGGSTDGSVEVIRSREDRLTAWTSEPDGGQADAVNRGFAKVDGEIMAWLNSDDLLLPGALATVGRYFRDHPEVDAVYGHRIIVDAGGQEVGRYVVPPYDPQVMKWADFVPQETLFWRRELWERVGGLDADLQFSLDWDLVQRFAHAGATVVRLPRYLGILRVHETCKTVVDHDDRGELEMGRLRRRELGRAVDPEEIWHAICPYVHQASLLQAYVTGRPDLF